MIEVFILYLRSHWTVSLYGNKHAFAQQITFMRSFAALFCIFFSPLIFAQSSCDCWIEPDNSYTLALGASDDGSSGQITLPFNFNFYGDAYNSVFINNNGNITFGGAFGSFSSTGFPNANNVMIAPFWADVDTRGSGQVWYKVTATALYVNWVDVGYFSSQSDKVNTFQVIITNGSDPILGVGNNVGLCYQDMQWSTGNASGGSGGFGGTPSSVGMNRGNGIDYFQITRNDHAGIDYDGPFGNADGVDWLDDKNFVLSTSTTTVNVAPLAAGTAQCDTVVVCTGQLTDIEFSFLSPENGQVTTATSDAPMIPDWTEISNVVGVVASVTGQFTPTQPGIFEITFTGTDNGTPNLSTTVTVVVQVINGPTTPPAISGPTTFCAGASITLMANGTFSNYVWSNGLTGQMITVFAPGTFTVTGGTGSCELTSSTFTVAQITPPVLQITGSQAFCGDSVTVLTASSGFSGYSWSNGLTGTSVTVPEGSYTVSGQFQGCPVTSPPFTVFLIDPGAPAILGNTEVCGNVGTTLGIDPSPYDSFSWSTGAITPSITVVGPGVYSVYAVFGDCDYTSEIEVVDLASTIQLITIIGPSTITGTDPVQFTATPFLPDADSIVWTLPNGWVWGDDLDHFDAEALVIPASDAGEYTICATSYTEGCAGNELCYSTLVTGMFGILSNNMDVLAYPNPTTGLFTISCGSNSIPTDVRITDQLGRAVTTKQVRRTAGNLQLDMDGLAEGRYTIAFRVDGKLVRSAVVVGR